MKIILIALIGAALSGCVSTGDASQTCPPPKTGYNLCALREVVMNPYADPETRRMAMMILADAAATTPDQHALVRSLAQQPQMVVVPVVPAY